jgi:hypothetical protein
LYHNCKLSSLLTLFLIKLIKKKEKKKEKRMSFCLIREYVAYHHISMRSSSVASLENLTMLFLYPGRICFQKLSTFSGRLHA